jgi:hypothetical protein
MIFPCIYVLYPELVHPLHFSPFFLSHLYLCKQKFQCGQTETGASLVIPSGFRLFSSFLSIILCFLQVTLCLQTGYYSFGFMSAVQAEKVKNNEDLNL